MSQRCWSGQDSTGFDMAICPFTPCTAKTTMSSVHWSNALRQSYFGLQSRVLSTTKIVRTGRIPSPDLLMVWQHDEAKLCWETQQLPAGKKCHLYIIHDLKTWVSIKSTTITFTVLHDPGQRVGCCTSEQQCVWGVLRLRDAHGRNPFWWWGQERIRFYVNTLELIHNPHNMASSTRSNYSKSVCHIKTAVMGLLCPLHLTVWSSNNQLVIRC